MYYPKSCHTKEGCFFWSCIFFLAYFCRRFSHRRSLPFFILTWPTKLLNQMEFTWTLNMCRISDRVSAKVRMVWSPGCVCFWRPPDRPTARPPETAWTARPFVEIPPPPISSPPQGDSKDVRGGGSCVPLAARSSRGLWRRTTSGSSSGGFLTPLPTHPDPRGSITYFLLVSYFLLRGSPNHRPPVGESFKVRSHNFLNVGNLIKLGNGCHRLMPCTPPVEFVISEIVVGFDM